MQKDFVDLGGWGNTSLKNISVSHMFNRGNYIFNPNFQKGTSSTKKTNFGIIQEPDLIARQISETIVHLVKQA